MRPSRIAATWPIAVRPPEANLGFTRIVGLGICSLQTPDVCCEVRVAAGALKQPRFNSNLSTFMSNCILVVTTLERNVSGRCRTTILPQARALPRVDTFPHGAFFIAAYAYRRRAVRLRLTQMSFFKYNLAVVKTTLLPVIERIRVTINST